MALRERGGAAGPARLASTGILDDATGETLPLRDRGGGLRAARPAVDPAGAARGPRRARRSSDGAAGARRRRTTCAATCTAHVASRRPQRRSRRWRARRASAACEYIAITDHSATHGFGNDVTPDALRAPDRARARAQRARSTGIEVLDRHRDEHPARRLARLRRRAAGRARLGRRLGPHVVRASPTRRDDRARSSPRSSTRWSTRSATPPGARSSRARPTRRRRRASSRRPRGPARCSRSTRRPTAATSTTSTRAPPPAAGVRILINSDAHGANTLGTRAGASPPRAAPG